jgi:hypothetical protein
MSARQEFAATWTDDDFDMAMVMRTPAQNRIRRNQDPARQQQQGKHVDQGASYRRAHSKVDNRSFLGDQHQ